MHFSLQWVPSLGWFMIALAAGLGSVSGVKVKRTIKSDGQVMYDLKPGGIGMLKGANIKVMMSW